jgi:peptide deformylase
VRVEPLTAIVQAGAAVLRGRAAEVAPEAILGADLQALFARMIDVMRAAPGVGLAAPQIGVPLRVFVVEDREELLATVSAEERAERERVPVPAGVFVNPIVTPIGDEQVTFFEGCLSVAGFAALVPRFREVEVSALDDKARPVTWRVRGWPARILQHEMDHLDGALYIDRMHTRSFGTGPQLKERFTGKSIADVLREHGLR